MKATKRVFGMAAAAAALAISLSAAHAENADGNQVTQSTTSTSVTTVTPGATVTTATATPGTPMSASGRVAGLNFARQRFLVVTDNGPVRVEVGNASITFNGQTANLYRLMGSPTVAVSGVSANGLLTASSINITSGPQSRLQQSSYTSMAQPPFSQAELAPLHYGSGMTSSKNGGSLGWSHRSQRRWNRAGNRSRTLQGHSSRSRSSTRSWRPRAR